MGMVMLTYIDNHKRFTLTTSYPPSPLSTAFANIASRDNGLICQPSTTDQCHSLPWEFSFYCGLVTENDFILNRYLETLAPSLSSQKQNDTGGG